MLRDTIHDSPEYQATVDQADSDQPEDPVEATVPGEVRPIVSLEKGDIEFWMRVATIILLWMILQELKRGNR